MMFNNVTIYRLLLTLSVATTVVACAGSEEHLAATDPADTAALEEAEGRTQGTVPRARLERAAREDLDTAVADYSAGKSVARSVPGHLGNLASRVAQALPGQPQDAEFQRNRETYAPVNANPIRVAAQEPVSTLSIDVDTGAYANVRRYLNGGALPPQNAVRVEELINYFSYDYALPEAGGAPFSIVTELAPTPWNADTLLMQIGIKGFELPAASRPPANLVFLIDVSGSMQSADKLPLLKEAFQLLTRKLDARDSIAIVVYAGASGVVLEPTRGDDQHTILQALGRLRAGGSTNGGAGIALAYEVAREGFIDGGINRVVLATDGDFNVGTVNFDALLDLAERRRDTGVSLTTLGFGTGNYNDHLLEQLADAGNGNYGYIDNINEARKLLVHEMSATLQTIASDVKIQVEFNPAVVAEYRLIGYENRLLKREDFANDQVDAGEIGAGHTVTALYEVTPVDSAARRIEPLRYSQQRTLEAGETDSELAFVRLRYKAPDGDVSRLIEYPVRRELQRQPAATSDSFRFAAAVAAFGQKLQGSVYMGSYDYASIGQLAARARGADQFGYREEFLALVDRAAALDGGAAALNTSASVDTLN